eukprot:5567573-Ditylum_brightwellii.AAC.1
MEVTMIQRKIERDKDGGERAILVFNTGGGHNSTVTKRAWHMIERTNHYQVIKGYREKGEGRKCPIVNEATKASINRRELPVLLIVSYATLADNKNERELLIVPFEIMWHGIETDLMPVPFGGNGSMVLKDEEYPFEWDEEKLFLWVQKLNEENSEELGMIELNSPVLDKALNPINTAGRKKGRYEIDKNIKEWRKRLAMLPEEAVKKTLENNTNLYFNVEAENWQGPRR